MTPRTAQRLREAAQQVVTEVRAVDVPGGVLLATLALDDVLRQIDADSTKGRVTSRRLDQRLATPTPTTEEPHSITETPEDHR